MTMVLTDRTTNYDGSPSGENDVYTASGPILITFHSLAYETQLKVMSRSDTANFVPTMTIYGSRRVHLALAPGDEFYFLVSPVSDGQQVDLSFVDA